MKLDFDKLNQKIGLLSGNTGLSTTNSGSSTTLAISDNSKATAFSHQIEITQLAKAHTSFWWFFE